MMEYGFDSSGQTVVFKGWGEKRLTQFKLEESPGPSLPCFS